MVAKSYMAGLFGHSPIKPLQEHMTRVNAGVQHLVTLVEGMIAADNEQMELARRKIVDAEHDADDMKKELRHHLPKGLFMPVDRRDVLDVLTRQDQIINQAKDISGLVLGRRMGIPEAMQATFRVYTQRCVDAVGQALLVISALDELVETGFRGLEVDRVEKMIDKLDAVESETDELQVELRAMLFTLEDELRPTDTMFTYRLIEWMGEVADDAEKVGSRLQLMLAR